jgi:hypothetical protein
MLVTHSKNTSKTTLDQGWGTLKTAQHHQPQSVGNPARHLPCDMPKSIKILCPVPKTVPCLCLIELQTDEGCEQIHNIIHPEIVIPDI